MTADVDTMIDPAAQDNVGQQLELLRRNCDLMKRMLGCMALPPEQREAREIAAWLRRPVTARDLMRHSRIFVNADAARQALADLAAGGCGKFEDVRTGKRGRPTARFTPADTNAASGASAPVVAVAIPPKTETGTPAQAGIMAMVKAAQG